MQARLRPMACTLSTHADVSTPLCTCQCRMSGRWRLWVVHGVGCTAWRHGRRRAGACVRVVGRASLWYGGRAAISAAACVLRARGSAVRRSLELATRHHAGCKVLVLCWP